MLQSWQRGGGRGARVNALGAPTVAKQTLPGDPLQAQVEPVVPIPWRSKTYEILGATRSMLAGVKKRWVIFSWTTSL